MSSLLPARLDDQPDLTRRQIAQARRAEASATLEVFRYSLGARARSQMDQCDSQAAGDASQTALESELDLLDYGLARAGTSAAKIELCARHVERLATINDRRITRRFSG